MHTLAVIDALDNAIRQWGAGFDWPAEYVARLLLACACGGLIGLERELRGRQAGFRTNLLVCIGSALTMLVSISFAERNWARIPDANLNIDPARIAYGIMTGVGFLGAGTIVKSGLTVRGLTTAAGMWCVAAVGMAAGFGMYTITIITTILIVAALWILDYLEDGLPKLRYRIVVVRRRWEPGCIQATIKRFKDAGLHVSDVSFRRADNMQDVDVDVLIAFTRKQAYYALERQLEGDTVYQLMATREQ
jgi:putative Mg2+ transporter-C (MgtC) family protein